MSTKSRQLDGNVRASADQRKYVCSGKQEIVFKQMREENKIDTNGTDEVELLMIVIDRLRDPKLVDNAITKAIERLSANNCIPDEFYDAVTPSTMRYGG